LYMWIYVNIGLFCTNCVGISVTIFWLIVAPVFIVLRPTGIFLNYLTGN